MEEIGRIAREIRGKRVLLQLPEGLLPLLEDIVDVLERAGKEVVVDVDPTYGACDIREKERAAVRADAILHIGHAPMASLPNVYYVEWRKEADLEAMERAVRSIKGLKCLATTVNYRWILEKLKGPDIVTGRGFRVPYPGVVLGCDTGACDVEAEVNVFLGEGRFHPLAIWINTRRPTFVVDPRGRIEQVSFEDVLKKRLALLGFISGQRVGIAVSSKVGQNRIDLALQLKELAEKRGYRPILLVSDYLRPEYVEGLPLDFIVYTGCPRVAIEDGERFPIPLLTPEEFLMKLGLLKRYRIGWITSLPRGSEA